MHTWSTHPPHAHADTQTHTGTCAYIHAPRARAQDGIDIHENVAAALVKLGNTLAVPLPAGLVGVAAGEAWGVNKSE